MIENPQYRGAVVFGTADGLIAEGTGELGFAVYEPLLFEFRSSTGQSFIPKGINVVLFLLPMRDCLARPVLLLGSLGFALDATGRPGYLGAGILLDSGECRVQQVVIAARATVELLKEARKCLLDGDGRIRRPRESGCFEFFDRGMGAPANDARYEICGHPDEAVRVETGGYSLDSEEVAQAITLLSQLKGNIGRIVAIIPDSKQPVNNISPQFLHMLRMRLDFEKHEEHLKEEMKEAYDRRIVVEKEAERRRTEVMLADLLAQVDGLSRMCANLETEIQDSCSKIENAYRSCQAVSDVLRSIHIRITQASVSSHQQRQGFTNQQKPEMTAAGGGGKEVYPPQQQPAEGGVIHGLRRRGGRDHKPSSKNGGQYLGFWGLIVPFVALLLVIAVVLMWPQTAGVSHRPEGQITSESAYDRSRGRRDKAEEKVDKPEQALRYSWRREDEDCGEWLPQIADSDISKTWPERATLLAQCLHDDKSGPTNPEGVCETPSFKKAIEYVKKHWPDMDNGERAKNLRVLSHHCG